MIETAVAWAEAHAGITENPPGSNRVFVWDDYRAVTGVDAYAWPAANRPWCGALVWDALRHGGWTPPASWIGVSNIEAWGRQHGLYHEGPFGVRRGDVLILLGHGTHTGIARGDLAGGSVPTVEGNTSPGDEGSQDNGGCIALRHRTAAQVIGYVRVAGQFPKQATTPPPAEKEDDVALKHGDKGNAVRKFQEALQAWATAAHQSNPLPRSGADGDYGDETATAVVIYQRAAQIAPTGAIDGVTAALLGAYFERTSA